MCAFTVLPCLFHLVLWAEHPNYAQCIQRTKTYPRNTHPTPPVAARDHFSCELMLAQQRCCSWDWTSAGWNMVLVWLQFTSVQDGIYVLAKAHMRSTPSVRSFPNIAFEMVSMFVMVSRFHWAFYCLIDDGPLWSFQGDCLVLPLSMPLSSRWSMVWCPLLCACRFQAPQHFISSKKQATCEGCSALSRAAHHWSFRRWMSTMDTFQSVLLIPFFVEVHWICDCVRMMARVVWLSPPEAIQRGSFSSLLGDCFHLHCQRWLERCNWPHIFS